MTSHLDSYEEKLVMDNTILSPVRPIKKRAGQLHPKQPSYLNKKHNFDFRLQVGFVLYDFGNNATIII